MEPSKLVVDLGQVRRNVQKLKEHGRLCAMVKANAYGTDSCTMARFLTHFGVDILAVAHAHEGLALRKAGINCEILVLHAACHEAKTIFEADLQVAVSREEEIQAFASQPLHLHVDTGFTRFGCMPEEAPALAKMIPRLEGLMSHLSGADDALQIKRFQEIPVEARWHHIRSSESLHYPVGNMIRVGKALYQEALTLSTKISAIQPLKAGERVSYGGTFQAERDEKIAILPLGYADGLHRCYTGSMTSIGPIVGTICMDYVMVLLEKEAKVGDSVTLSIPHLLEKGEKTIYELMTGLGPRVARSFTFLHSRPRRKVSLEERTTTKLMSAIKTR